MAPVDPPEIAEKEDIHSILIKMAMETATSVANQVVVVDEALADLDQLLYRLQPKMTGRIRIQWWRKEKKDRYKRAVPAYWYWAKGSKSWLADDHPIPGLRRRGKTQGKFHRNREVMKVLLGVAQDLLEMRTKLINQIAAFSADTKKVVGPAGRKAGASKQTLRRIESEVDAGKHFDWSLEGTSSDKPDLT
ncbi:hypothetical protein [Methylibium petroleiphilum]|uniref:Uncharacterized protein n=1 Tax=Methylibium petroleiphilum (strain ATCC BAA-1232 / LMG 22953 / PM1) TaxID=420662 RepID=A2SMV8_METPP|nr:hypothetical protein [Methylibium petroleiphilum]ABM96897.1 hypothetical protein Mpe_B0118 [Methylibium petroleiphilum PM1]